MSSIFRTGAGRRRRQADPDLTVGPSGERCCEWPDCEAAGLYRAPKSRERLRDFRWFCLEHVRAYNRAWDFFAGMSRAEIETYLHDDVTWHRPTWRSGARSGWDGDSGVHDPYGVFGAEGGHAGRGRSGLPRRVEEMLTRLDLEAGCTLIELKRRYKQLVKRHHPDLHGGDRAAEERLKVINEAYTYLLASGLFT